MKLFKNSILSICIILHSVFIDAYRILGVFPFNAKSHNEMFNALMAGLAKRNHQVDVITHMPLKNPPPNYRTIINLSLCERLESALNSFSITRVLRSDSMYIIGEKLGNEICEYFLSLEEMQDFIKNPPNDPPYDLVITEVFAANCYIGLGHVLKVPVVGISSAMEFPWIADFSENHDNLAFVPSYFTENFDKTKFWHRLVNFVSHHLYAYKFRAVTNEAQTKLIKKYLGDDVPGVRELEKSLALILVNRHFTINGPKPISPSVIEVAGLHLEGNDPPKLNTELKTWLDESINGVVYISFGSLVLLETLPSHMMKGLYKSIENIAPTRVLIKIFDKSKLLPGLPENVKILPWVPQRTVLGHKNVRVFITQGGLMSLQEALYYGVPVIGIPLFSDQPQNLDRFVGMNMAIKIDFENFTTASLDKALNAMLNESKYRDNAKLHSKLFKDRPMMAMETAIFWVEYVIRNGNILKPDTSELAWWQLALFDVYTFLLIFLILVIVLIYYMTYNIMVYLKKILFKKLKVQ